MATNYAVNAVYYERDGARKGFAVVTPTFDCSISRDFYSLDAVLRASAPGGTAAWMVEGIGTKHGNLSIQSLEKAVGTHHPIRALDIIELDLAFGRFLRQ
jgi:hypothetical protein